MKFKVLFICLFSSFILVNANVISSFYRTTKTVDESKSFEGTISFTKLVGSSESKYNYIVKGNKIRIEELDNDEKIQGIMIVNTSTNKIIALSPERKLYMDVPNKRTISIPKIEQSKGTSTKTLNGVSTIDWIATSNEEDRVISYWLDFKKYDFFIPLLKTLNRKDKQATYYLALSGVDGAFPLLSVEKKLDGTELSRLTVSSITKKSVADSQFDIPNGYTKFDK